jgi:hypothetical protein
VAVARMIIPFSTSTRSDGHPADALRLPTPKPCRPRSEGGHLRRRADMLDN